MYGNNLCLHGKWLAEKPEQQLATMESMHWRNAGTVAGDCFENDKMWHTVYICCG